MERGLLDQTVCLVRFAPKRPLVVDLGHDVVVEHRPVVEGHAVRKGDAHARLADLDEGALEGVDVIEADVVEDGRVAHLVDRKRASLPPG